MATMAEELSTEIYELDLDWDLVQHIALPDSFDTLRIEGLSPSLIEDEYVRGVWEWAVDHYHEHRQQATASVLEAQFDEIAIDKPLTAVGDLLDRLRYRYVKNYGRDVIKTVAASYKEEPLSLATEMSKAARELSELISKRGEVWGTGDTDRSILEYHKHVTKGVGPSYGFEEVDQHFHGQRGVTFWLAPPKGMKSWIGAVNVAVENIMQGRAVFVYSLELPAFETNMRIRCMAADVPWWKFVKGQMDPEDLEHMRTVGEVIDSYGLFRVEKPPMGERDAALMTQRAIDAGADLVVFDQLQYIQDRTGTPLGDRNETGAYWGIGNVLRDLSDQIPINVIHQFNRTTMFADEMPSMQQAKGSSMIEEVGTTVLGLWANKDMRHSRIVELGTLASRNFDLVSWEISVNLSKGCKFELIGKVEHDGD